MADSFIFIDRSTSFNGTVTANEVVVEGLIKGDVTASDKVLIKSGGVINGNIRTAKLLFEEGGEHNGLVRLGREPMTEDLEAENMSQVEDQLAEQNAPDSASSEGKGKKNGDKKRLW